VGEAPAPHPPSGLTGSGNPLVFAGFLVPFIDYMLPAVILTILVMVLASGFVYSAEFGSYCRALEGSYVNIPMIMVEFRRRWKPMAWTLLLSYLVTFSSIALFGLAAVAMFSFGLIGVIPATLFFLFGFLGVAVVASSLVYSPVAVCADGYSGFGAIRKSLTIFAHYPGATLTYSVVYILLTTVITTLAGVVPGLSLPLASLVSVGVLIIVTPVLHLSKTSLYRQVTTNQPPGLLWYRPMQGDLGQSLFRMMWSKFRIGLTQVKLYTLDRRNLPYHLIATVSMVAGLITGAVLARNGIDEVIYGLGYIPGRVNPLITGSLPFTLSVYIFLHNWQVSLGTALSGVYVSVFPLGTLFLNGVIIGIVSTLVPNVLMLAAALLPHGVIEVPSFIIAGSAGIRLGVIYARAMRRGWSEDSQAALGHAASQTIYLVVGLALLFFIAGIIEGNVTPWVMKLAGWS